MVWPRVLQMTAAFATMLASMDSPQLLIVYHSHTDGSRQMAEAARAGAASQAGVDVRLLRAPDAGPAEVLAASARGERDFTGKGSSAQSNRLQGSVTVTVIQRLPNGNLVVQGQKSLRLNQGDELVQIQGIVRAADIATDNTIPSSKVADARIAYGGRGAVAQSNAMGWLGRFFNSRLAPY